MKAKQKLLSFFKGMLFVAAAFVLCLAAVFPLWALATKAPKVYTAASLVLAAFFAAWKIFAFAKKRMSKKSAKKDFEK